ncbi:hypothetical protein [Salipiger aestuarii]|uniref:hypothetical protein n=1 Tax=Salipiger aestuarii TaxID=568098 RepID=UPI0012390AF8|nr:hypothetical protein [Salipiger aestuarii]
MSGISEKTLVAALVSYAAQDGLGEQVAWPDIEAAIATLACDPMGPKALREAVRAMNDRDVVETLEDWLLSEVARREAAARAAARPSEKIVAPIQSVSFGAGVTAAALALAGTVSLVPAAIMGTAALCSGFAASWYRMRFARAEDDAQAEAAAIRRLAEICASEKRNN